MEPVVKETAEESVETTAPAEEKAAETAVSEPAETVEPETAPDETQNEDAGQSVDRVTNPFGVVRPMGDEK